MIQSIIIIIVVLFGIQRFISNHQAQLKSSLLVDDLSDEEYRIEFANSLDVSILKKGVENFDKILRKLPINTPDGFANFTINHCSKIGSTCYLFTTLAEYKDLAPTRHGNKVVSNDCDLNFKLVLEIDSKNIVIYSDLYTELADKNLRTEFANLLYEYLTN